jgi:hypothetical protein
LLAETASQEPVSRTRWSIDDAKYIRVGTASNKTRIPEA